VNLARLHRRLAVFMSLASLLAFAGGAGVEPLAATLAAFGLILALFWQPDSALSARMERVWLPLAFLLVARALVHVFIVEDDVVVPVVDLLFLLLVAESLRSLDTRNDVRLYSLSFALLLASTAYRPGLLFLLAFVAYIVFATVALIVGHLRREATRHGISDIPVARSFLIGASGLSMVILAVAVGVFLVFPRVTRGWAGRGETMATSIAGFSDEVALGSHGARIYGNPQIVLRVEFPAGPPENLQTLHWRGRSFDRFDGFRWSRSSRLPPSRPPPVWYDRWGTESITQRIYSAPLDSRVLFALHPLLDVASESGIQPTSNNAGDHLYWGFGPPHYTARSLDGRPGADELRNARGNYVPARSFYTQLPPLSPQVQALADSLLAHLPTDFDRAVALETWFREEFRYTLDLPATAREATLENFLLNRRAGHCEYFSTAMAILLRTQGIATREVNGFAGGTWSEFGDYLAVTQNQAHAWVEVWFPTYGWVPFDPTPPGRGEVSGLTSWFWPGRFLFDAVQHRWNKWVLDYSFQSQFMLFERSRETVSRALSPREADEGDSGEATRWEALLAALILALVVAAMVRRSGPARNLPEESRTYVRLRDTLRRAGAPRAALHSPQSLVSYLQDLGHPVAPGVHQVVERYLRARFSGLPPRLGQERAHRETLQEVLRGLKQRPLIRKDQEND